MRYQVTTDHHRVPESYGGLYTPENILKIKEHKHRAFHLIMDNLTPVRQHERLLRRINGQVHSTAFYNDMMQVLDHYKGEDELYAYKNGVLVPEKFLQAQEKFNR